MSSVSTERIIVRLRGRGVDGQQYSMVGLHGTVKGVLGDDDIVGSVVDDSC
jgi:hypothetical protein